MLYSKILHDLFDFIGEELATVGESHLLRESHAQHEGAGSTAASRKAV